MLHLVQDGKLKADKIARKGKVQYLPSAVRQSLVTKRPPIQNGVEMRALVLFLNNGRSGFDHQFTGLEIRNEVQFLVFQRAEYGFPSEGAGLAIGLKRDCFGHSNGISIGNPSKRLELLLVPI